VLYIRFIDAHRCRIDALRYEAR